MADPIEVVAMKLFLPEGRADPYPIYHELRSRSPVVQIGPNAFVLSRHADVAMLRDRRFVHVWPTASVSPDARDPWDRFSSRFMLFMDPPDHTRIRSLVTSAFTPRVVERLRPRIENIVDGLITSAIARGSMDMIADLAYPLPVTVICELLGLPHEDRDDFRRWSRALAPAFEDSPPDVMERAVDATERMTERLGPIISSQRQSPGDDLLDALVAAGQEDGRLTHDELVANIILLFFGGHETTVNLIGNGTLALMRNRSQWERLVDDPSLARGAVEELLRFDAPIQLTGRTASADVDLGGTTIATGSKVHFSIGSANHDPEVFDDPDVLDITRVNASQHLAFGAGMHYCVGAALARLEAEVAFAALATRLPQMRLATEAPNWRDTMILRGLADLPVAI